MYTPQQIIAILNTSEIKWYLKKHGIVHLSLFWSALDGTTTPQSDVDLLYEQHPSRELGWEIIDIINYISQKLNAPIDLVEKNALHERIKAKVLHSTKKIF
jgi:predicted nucleotidyltransferase